MNNAEKYKTVKERLTAFNAFCHSFPRCDECPVHKRSSEEGDYCKFIWLELEAEEEQMTISEVADILTEHNKWRRGEGEYADAGAKCNITPKELGIAIDRAVEILRSIKE